MRDENDVIVSNIKQIRKQKKQIKDKVRKNIVPPAVIGITLFALMDYLFNRHKIPFLSNTLFGVSSLVIGILVGQYIAIVYMKIEEIKANNKEIEQITFKSVIGQELRMLSNQLDDLGIDDGLLALLVKADPRFTYLKAIFDTIVEDAILEEGEVKK